MTEREERMAAEIAERLAREGLGSYALKVRCTGGTVSLQGIVDVLAEKIAAEGVAHTTPGVESVQNDITVCTDGPIDDSDVALEIAEELAAEPIGAGVGAEVSGGRVRLKGRVKTVAAAAQAIAAVSKARGVREVSSELKLAAEAETDDPSLVNAVQGALAEVLGHGARYIRIDVHDGVVLLTGDLPSEVAVDKAVEVAAHVPGVRRVEDRLQARLALPAMTVGKIIDRIASNPSLRAAPLVFHVQEGKLVAEGEVENVEARRALDKVLRETLASLKPQLRGIDNRVRVTR